MSLSIGVYACELEQIGLPTEGLSWNGEILSNHYERIHYLDSLDESQKIAFIDRLLEKAWDAGRSSVELEEVDD
jgi:hypothetical protein